MRQIHIPAGSTPPQDWMKRADALTVQLLAAPDDATRLALVWANRRLWRDKGLLAWLSGLSHGKCWYSEALESVSAYHVDHFRPKGRATQSEGTKRAGYWWLVFDWKNYRVCGQLLNVKKRDLFPVEFPGLAAAGKPATLDVEACSLIDPLKPEAWLISFERGDNGECVAEPSPGVDGDDLKRVTITIEVLGLNRLVALNKNRAGIWDQCFARIQDYKNAGNEPILNTCEALRFVAARALVELSSEAAEFSSVAKACIAKLAPLALRQHVHYLAELQYREKAA